MLGEPKRYIKNWARSANIVLRKILIKIEIDFKIKIIANNFNLKVNFNFLYFLFSTRRKWRTRNMKISKYFHLINKIFKIL